MVLKFANPHSLSQDVEVTTRSEIAERAGSTSVVYDERLKNDLDNLLRDSWGDALSRVGKHRKMAESLEDEDGQLVFRLVSSMKEPRPISLDHKPTPQSVTREPDCEDDERQAEARKIRALTVAVDSQSLEKSLVSQVSPKPVVVAAKAPLTNMSLPPLFATEEVRTTKRTKSKISSAQSPHEPRLSCVVVPVVSIPDKKEMRGKKRRKPVKERPPPAYWRPSPSERGKCMGYALGYPSSWAPDQVYVRDTMKRGVKAN